LEHTGRSFYIFRRRRKPI